MSESFNPVLAVLRIRDALQGVDGYELDAEIADCESLLCFLYTTRPPEPMSPEERKRASKAARQAKWRANKASTSASPVDTAVDAETSTKRLHAPPAPPSRAASESLSSPKSVEILGSEENEDAEEKRVAEPSPRASTRRLQTPPVTAPTWTAYAASYRARYGADPLRNATVNGQLAGFLKRVPVDEAPHVAQHYVASNNARYVSAGHAVGCLLQDAEKLRTEWLTGRSLTAHEARATDRTSGRAQQYEQTFAQLRAEDRGVKHG